MSKKKIILPDDPRDWPAETKVALIEAMGFTPMRDTHTSDCPAGMSWGYVCNCVPDATMWAQPADVDAFRHETWDERLAAAKKRHAESA